MVQIEQSRFIKGVVNTPNKYSHLSDYCKDFYTIDKLKFNDSKLMLLQVCSSDRGSLWVVTVEIKYLVISTTRVENERDFIPNFFHTYHLRPLFVEQFFYEN